MVRKLKYSEDDVYKLKYHTAIIRYKQIDEEQKEIEKEMNKQKASVPSPSSSKTPKFR